MVVRFSGLARLFLYVLGHREDKWRITLVSMFLSMFLPLFPGDDLSQMILCD